MKLDNAAALAALIFSPISVVGFYLPTSTFQSLPRSTGTNLDTFIDFTPHIAKHRPTTVVLYSSLSDDKSISKSSKGLDTQKTEDDIVAAFETPSSKILSHPIPYSQLTIGVTKETFKGENRVSVTPESAEMLIKAGFQIVVQTGAGENASFTDAAYVEKGAVVLPGEQIYTIADIFTKIRPPSREEVPKLAGKTLVGIISPSINTELYESLAEQKTNVFALDCVPRMLSRAQSYDVLSSQANIAGYRAMIEAAEEFPRFFAGQMTAAGKVPPAKVLVLGAGEILKVLYFKAKYLCPDTDVCSYLYIIIYIRCCWSCSYSNCKEHGGNCSRF